MSSARTVAMARARFAAGARRSYRHHPTELPVAKINTARVIQGGLLAGFVINIISFINNAVIAGPKLRAAREAGKFLMTPRFPFYPAWLIAMFLLGLELVWLYAAVRPRFGPGPRTALTVGLVVGLLSALPDHLANGAWRLPGGYLPFP